MPEEASVRRENQRSRTRKDLLRAAAALMREGRNPTLEEVAEAALVSRATAYRYFSGIEALLVEAALDVAVPEPEALFRDMPAGDPVSRLQAVDDALRAMIAENEGPLRMMLAQSMAQALESREGAAPPLRQNRRVPLIEAALAPHRAGFEPAAYDLLVKAMALVVGTEAMVVFRDVLRLDDAEAVRISRWMTGALVEAARAQSAAGR